MKLSVFLVTYNQERYIRQALESIVMQQVNFDYEVIVGDDCSTDATPEICDEYEANYPQITVYHHKKNKGLLGNWEFVMNMCQGEYIALLEGDDYWIDPLKLQKQVDFLDTHKEFSFCFSSADILIEDGGKEGWEQSLKRIDSRAYTIDDFYSSLFLLSSTVVLRNCLQPIHYDNHLQYADHYTFILLFQHGLGYGFPEQMSMYRVHDSNLSRQETNYLLTEYKQAKYLKKIFPERSQYYQEVENKSLIPLFYERDTAIISRLIYIKDNPRLFFSKFMLTTIIKYIFRLK